MKSRACTDRLRRSAAGAVVRRRVPAALPLLAPALLLSCSAALAPLQVQAARVAGAPLTELTGPVTHVMVAGMAGPGADGRVRFERIEVLHGAGDAAAGAGADAAAGRDDAPLDPRADAIIELRVGDDAVGDLRPSRRYVVAWTEVMSHPQYREIKVRDPDGPRVVTVPGLGLPAIFEASAELRWLFATVRAEPAPPSAAVLQALLTQMARPAPRARALAVRELLARPELVAGLEADGLTVIRQVLADRRLAPLTRDDLLQLALAAAPAGERDWLADEHRAVLARSGTRLELASYVPGLVITALRGLARTGRPGDAAWLAPFVYSNAPGVAREALFTMHALDAETAARVAQQAVGDDSLHLETRRVLGEYERRRGADPPDRTP